MWKSYSSQHLFYCLTPYNFYLSHSGDLLLMVFISHFVTCVMHYQFYIFNFSWKLHCQLIVFLVFFCLKHLENKRTINYKISYHSILRPHGRGQISHKRGKLKKKFFSTPTHVGKRKKCIVVISTKEGVTNMTVKWPRIFLGYLSHSGYLLSSVVSWQFYIFNLTLKTTR